jgi:hypothetical protein
VLPDSQEDFFPDFSAFQQTQDVNSFSHKLGSWINLKDKKQK